MAEDRDAEYRAQVKEAEGSLLAALQAVAEGEHVELALDDPDAPLYRLGDALRTLIGRLDAVSRERDRLRAVLAARDGEGRPGGLVGQDAGIEFSVLYELGRSLSAQLGPRWIRRKAYGRALVLLFLIGYAAMRLGGKAAPARPKGSA